jgi:hypothetical protein
LDEGGFLCLDLVGLEDVLGDGGETVGKADGVEVVEMFVVDGVDGVDGGRDSWKDT